MSALVFDCDGVLADTERDGHRPAFNQTFREFGLPVEWDVEEYGRRLRIGGGKERMASLLTPEFVAANGLPADPEGQAELLAGWHKRKTAIYTEMVVDGQAPAAARDPPDHHRGPGRGLEARHRIDLGRSVGPRDPRVRRGQGAGRSLRRLPRRRRASRRRSRRPTSTSSPSSSSASTAAEVLVVEDSRNGLEAAHAAGLRCLVTVNGYTEKEDFSEAILVVSSLGDPDGEQTTVIANRSAARPGAFVTLADLEACLAS